MNSLSALVLFDSGTIRSFVSRYFSRSFDMTLINLECPLRVSITENSGFCIKCLLGLSLGDFWGALLD